jgi:carboxymethylenebutenolidase
MSDRNLNEKTGEMITYKGSTDEIEAYLARPSSGSEKMPATIVIHEIFGLSDHIKDVANRFAAQGYVALAPDLFSRKELYSSSPLSARSQKVP